MADAKKPSILVIWGDDIGIANLSCYSDCDWFLHHAYLVRAAQAIVTPFLATFKDYPPRQKAASFTVDQAMEKMEAAASGAGH